MDYGYKFEKVINHYIGTPDYVTYATNWSNDKERTALLYTACIKQYDGHSTGETGDKLMYYMEEIFKDGNDKKISIECMNFLNELNSNKIF